MCHEQAIFGILHVVRYVSQPEFQTIIEKAKMQPSNSFPVDLHLTDVSEKSMALKWQKKIYNPFSIKTRIFKYWIRRLFILSRIVTR